MTAMLNNDNSIFISNDCVTYDSRHGSAPNVSMICELFLKFFSKSDSIRVIANILDIEIVAVVRQPYGKHSTFFKEHHSHRFDSLIVSSALGKIPHAKPLSLLNYLSDGSLLLEIPIYINDCCTGYVIVGPFYMSEESAGGSPNSLPVIQPDKVKMITRHICEIGGKILSDCTKYLRKPNNFQHLNIDAEMVFNFGNIFLFDITSDTYVMSPNICDIFGFKYVKCYTFADFVDTIVEDDKLRVVDFCKRNILLGDKDYVIETTIIRQTDGRPVNIEISGAIIKDKNGRSVKTVGYVKDVTDLNTTHDRLCQEISSKNRLIKIIGHDLKNPFNGMIGFSEILKVDLDQHNYEEAAEYAEIIKQAASEGYELLVNLLDYSTSQSADMTTVKKEFDIYKTVDSIIKLSSTLALRKGITIENHIEFPTMVFSDENKINTILRNLISNAIKFCFQDGIVMVTAKQKGDSICIAVSDTGENIPAFRLREINNAHDISSTTGTAYESGTSIGLKLCYSYLRALDSRLVATSDDGVTTFKFTIKANGDKDE